MTSYGGTITSVKLLISSLLYRQPLNGEILVILIIYTFDPSEINCSTVFSRLSNNLIPPTIFYLFFPVYDYYEYSKVFYVLKH